MIYGFHIIKQGDPPPTFSMELKDATHLELLKVPLFNGEPYRSGVYLLATWADKTVYLAWWGHKDSLLKHMAKHGVTSYIEEERFYSQALEKEYLANARPRPAFRKLA